MRNRYYDPAVGQFHAIDPKGYAAGFNLFGYTSGDPVNRWDPWGLDDDETTVEAAVSIGKGVGKGFIGFFGGIIKTVGHAAGRLANTATYAVQRPFTTDPYIPFTSSEKFYDQARTSLKVAHEFGVDATGSAIYQATGDPLYLDSFNKMENIREGLNNELKVFNRMPVSEQRELVASGTVQAGMAIGSPVIKGVGATKVPFGKPLAQTWVGTTSTGSRYLSFASRSSNYLITQTSTLQRIMGREINFMPSRQKLREFFVNEVQIQPGPNNSGVFTKIQYGQPLGKGEIGTISILDETLTIKGPLQTPGDGLKIIRHTTSGGKLKRVLSRGLGSFKNTKLDFVITKQGSIIFGRGHTVLSKGNNVAFAGRLKFNKSGEVVEISNWSGHFQPPSGKGLTQAAKEYLYSKGIDTSKASVQEVGITLGE